jgi:hypothetical protein
MDGDMPRVSLTTLEVLVGPTPKSCVDLERVWPVPVVVVKVQANPVNI